MPEPAHVLEELLWLLFCAWQGALERIQHEGPMLRRDPEREKDHPSSLRWLHLHLPMCHGSMTDRVETREALVRCFSVAPLESEQVRYCSDVRLLGERRERAERRRVGTVRSAPTASAQGTLLTQ